MLQTTLWVFYGNFFENSANCLVRHALFLTAVRRGPTSRPECGEWEGMWPNRATIQRHMMEYMQLDVQLCSSLGGLARGEDCIIFGMGEDDVVNSWPWLPDGRG